MEQAGFPRVNRFPTSPCLVFSMSSLSVTGLTFGIGFTFWALYRIRTRAREFAQLPGPPNPSVLSGNLDDVRAAPAGTRFNVWQAKYGATYCIRGALLVFALPSRSGWQYSELCHCNRSQSSYSGIRAASHTCSPTSPTIRVQKSPT
jgi:hypothetical protein